MHQFNWKWQKKNLCKGKNPLANPPLPPPKEKKIKKIEVISNPKLGTWEVFQSVEQFTTLLYDC